MAVLVIADVPGQTTEGFAKIMAGIQGALKQAPGFILVTGFPTKDSWQTIEVWETAREATHFYANFVHPNLPAGLQPKRTLHELQNFVMR